MAEDAKDLLLGPMARLVSDTVRQPLTYWTLRRAVRRGHVRTVRKVGQFCVFERRHLTRVIRELKAAGYLDKPIATATK